MKYATRLAIISISLFLVSCTANINAVDEINNEFKAYEAINKELIDLFGQEPYIIGIITALEEGGLTSEEGDGSFRVLIEEDPEVNSPLEPGGNKVWLTIKKETEVLIKDENNNVSDIGDRNLELGQIAGGWVAGEIAYSYPAQAVAQRVVIVNP